MEGDGDQCRALEALLDDFLKAIAEYDRLRALCMTAVHINRREPTSAPGRFSRWSGEQFP